MITEPDRWRNKREAFSLEDIVGISRVNLDEPLRRSKRNAYRGDRKQIPEFPIRVQKRKKILTCTPSLKQASLRLEIWVIFRIRFVRSIYFLTFLNHSFDL